MDVFASICDWLELGSTTAAQDAFSVLDRTTQRHRGLSITQSEMALRTAAWSWQGRLPIDEMDRGQLYVKPDDRYEVNDVADLCQNVAARCQKEASHFLALAREGKIHELPPLVAELSQPYD